MITPKHQLGMSMIEVLVTLFIVAIGVLGMAGLQFVSIKNANSSLQRYQATLLGHDMVERMRANLQIARAGSYVATAVNGGESPVTCPCTAAQLATRDIYEWGQLIKSNLPNGGGSITLNSGRYTVALNWSEQQTGRQYAQAGAAATVANSFSIVFQP
jgi:type IV pilus assembly protein PilV